MEHSKHIWRLSILLILLLNVGILARHFLMPESFGDAGFYRYDALTELTSLAPHHGAVDACTECHEEQADAKAKGNHREVQCEACHNTLSSHVRDGEMYTEMTINRSYRLCANCHEKLLARPETIPQIILAEHLELEASQAIAEEACLECHDSQEIHSP